MRRALIPLVCLLLPAAAHAQTESIDIPLRVVETDTSWASDSATFTLANGDTAFSIPFESAPGARGAGPEGVGLVIHAVDVDPALVMLQIDLDANGDIAEEPVVALREGEDRTIRLRRGERTLPYTFRLSSRERNGALHANIWFFARYHAEGELRVGDASAPIALRDLNQDGLFDEHDLGGASIVLDRNGDGQFKGQSEYIQGDAVFTFAGEHFTADPAGLALDGSSLRLRRTAAPIPALGEPASEFELTFLDGSTLHSADLRGRVVLIDFWAAWCAPCVAKLPAVLELERKLGDDLTVLYIDTDVPRMMVEAEEIAERFQLPPSRTVISGDGPSLPAWRMFGSMTAPRMSLPMYVVINAGNHIVYAGPGDAEDLDELRNAVEKAVAELLLSRATPPSRTP